MYVQMPSRGGDATRRSVSERSSSIISSVIVTDIAVAGEISCRLISRIASINQRRLLLESVIVSWNKRGTGFWLRASLIGLIVRSRRNSVKLLAQMSCLNNIVKHDSAKK